MKTLAAFLFCLPMLAWGQQSSLSKIATFTDADSNRAHVTVSGKAFSLMAKMEVDEVLDEQVQRLANSIVGMEAFMAISANTAQKIVRALDAQKAFETYASINLKDERIIFFVNENNGIVTEMIVVMISKNSGAATSVFGKMDIRDVGKMYTLIQSRGFEYLNEQDAE